MQKEKEDDVIGDQNLDLKLVQDHEDGEEEDHQDDDDLDVGEVNKMDVNIKRRHQQYKQRYWYFLPPLQCNGVFGERAEISPVFKTQKKKIAQMESLLTARITKINIYGVVNIMFSKSQQKIDDLSLYKDKQTLTLVVEPVGANSLPYTLTNWTAISLSGSTLKLKISFPNPNEISLTTNFDTLKISFAIPTFFQSADEKSILKKGYFTTGKIPPQNLESINAVSLQKARQSMNNLLVSSLGANLALFIVCGNSMNNLLQLMNILQIITMIPLMKVSTPPQFISFCQIVQDFANVNMLPETYSLKGIKAVITGTPIQNPISAGRRLESNGTQQSSELSQNFQMMGFQTESIIDNLGNTVQVLYLLSLAVILLIILQMFINHKTMQEITTLLLLQSYENS